MEDLHLQYKLIFKQFVKDSTPEEAVELAGTLTHQALEEVFEESVVNVKQLARSLTLKDKKELIAQLSERLLENANKYTGKEKEVRLKSIEKITEELKVMEGN